MSRRKLSGRCKHGKHKKIKYESIKQAEKALDKCKKNHREECRIYFCYICKGYHLTREEYDPNHGKELEE